MRPFGAACDRYRLHLEEENKDKVQEDIDSKQPEMINELQSVKENCHGRFNERILYFLSQQKKLKKTMILNS